MLTRLDFYLAFFSFIIMMGSGISFANNMGQIVKAVKNDAHASAATMVTIFSVFNSCGRVLYGLDPNCFAAGEQAMDFEFLCCPAWHRHGFAPNVRRACTSACGGNHGLGQLAGSMP